MDALRANKRLDIVVGHLTEGANTSQPSLTSQAVAGEAAANSASVVVTPITKDGITLRRLAKTDFEKGFPAILSQLTSVGKVTKADFEARFDRISSMPDTYYVMVMEDEKNSRIVGAATLLIEDKFIHGCGRVGHIEDVVVDRRYRGLSLGARYVSPSNIVA